MGFEGETWYVRGAAPVAVGTGGDPESRGDAESGLDPRLGGGGADIGEILIDEADFPWLSGRFRAGPAFGAVEDLFARELALAEGDDAAHRSRWEATQAEIERTVRLISPDGPVAAFLLHIRGDRAWFRWSDAPFDDEGDEGDEGAGGAGG